MIDKLNQSNLNTCAELAHRLWPDASVGELITDFKQVINDPNWQILLYRDSDHYSAFIQCALRTDYVEGCTTKPVLYIEGIYVSPEQRRKGVAGHLIAASEEWGRSKGCREIASDAELKNQTSIDFHMANGFEEMNRIVAFRRLIKQG